ncbi:VOC family protein [Actinomadura sp. 7K507]|uniref:VOC family protein n=1 Tax=Actinomadura sp. 7K507 TaxID=2530365 RepID=UPI001048ADC3|nr:VOC family protein [Actinomadura sp. 7K507]TDC90224.1 glyoxalase [Actinomadura sp. 7K507]
MTEGVRTIIYPVGNLDKAKALYSRLLGVEPYMDEPYYVGFEVGDQNIGLDPHGHRLGAVAYWHVDDIEAARQELLDADAEPVDDIKDVGNKFIATVKDADGNIIGLLQNA